MKTIQLTVSMLYTGFVGLRESEITTKHPLGPHLHYLGSEQLDLGLTSSCYAISQNQTFLLTIETINGERTVVAQKTYWGGLMRHTNSWSRTQLSMKILDIGLMQLEIEDYL